MKRISLVLIDDQPSRGEGVGAVMRARPDFHVLAAAVEPVAALRRVCKAKPDLVLLQLRWETGASVMLAGAVHGSLPESRVIILGLDSGDGDVASFVRARVSGFLMADASFDRYLSTIRSVTRGIQVLPAELIHRLFAQLGAAQSEECPRRTRELERLRPQERAVTDLLSQGLSDSAIAARLRVTRRTVRAHIRTALADLARNGRMQVAAFSQPDALGPAV